MCKGLWTLALLVLAGSTGWAGAPVNRGGRTTDFWSATRQRTEDNDVFDTARRRLTLNGEQQAAIQKLDGQRDAEERAALAKIQAELDKKYVALILDIVPDAEKAKFQKVFDAMVARDALIDAAKEAILDVLTKLEADEAVASQRDPDYIPDSKTDVIRRFIKLSDPQRKTLEDARRAGFTAMREKMRNVQRPQDWRDTAARNQYMLAIQKLQDEVDDNTAETMVALLSEAQAKAYTTAADALALYQKKVKAAEDAYMAAIAPLGVKGVDAPAEKNDF